jgi:hypothetical protein
VAALRKSPGDLGGAALPSSLLRHADEQTVVGLAAVLRAIREHGLDPGAFGTWGVAAAPQYLGRTSFFRASFAQFLAEGAWGVSPHLISNLSLHSPSGAVSVALKAQGPNLGAGGGPGGELSALVLAAIMIDGGRIPGAWVVLTGWEPDSPGERPEAGLGAYLGCALALVPSTPAWTGARVEVGPDGVTWLPPEGKAEPRPRLADWARDAAIVGEDEGTGA